MKPTENTEEQEMTPAQVLSKLKANLPLRRAQVEMQELNTRMVHLRVQELEAMAKLQQFQAEQSRMAQESIVEYVITEQDIKNNPEMLEQGIKVGQTIGIPKEVFQGLNLEGNPDNPYKEGKNGPSNFTEDTESQEKEAKLNPLSVVKD